MMQQIQMQKKVQKIKLVEWLISMEAKSINTLASSNFASIRLRAAVGAKAAEKQGISNQFTDGRPNEIPDLIIVGKIDYISDKDRPSRWLRRIKELKSKKTKIIIDYTDHHLSKTTESSRFYIEALNFADVVICSSNMLMQHIKHFYNGPILLIEDPVEVPILPPKIKKNNIPTALWFGHASNLGYLIDFLRNDYKNARPIKLIVMTNLYPLPDTLIKHFEKENLENLEINVIPWSKNDMIKVAGIADVCWIPAGLNDARKNGASSNRLITALAMGLPVAADILPSYEPLKDYFVDIKENEFYEQINFPEKYFSKVKEAQNIIKDKYISESIKIHWLQAIGNEENNRSINV
jgi:hypothetical protein